MSRAPALRLVAGRRAQSLRYPARPAGRELDARVARVAGDEHLPVAQGRVFEAQRGPAHLREAGAERELVVEEGGPAVADEGLHDDDPIAPFLELFVGEPGGAEPLDTPHLEVGEVVGVVDHPLRVGLGVTDAEFRLVDYYYRPLNSGLRRSAKAPMPSRASSVAKRRANWSASYSRPLTRSTSIARFVADFACRTARGPFAAISAAISFATFSASPWGTTRLTSPISCASSAPMRRAVKMSSFASAGPTRRGSRWGPPMPGSIPKETSGNPKVAFSAATRTSQARATSQPPPKA